MSMQRMMGMVSVACALALAGCDEELEDVRDSGSEPSEVEDADEQDAHDAGQDEPRSDGGEPDAGSAGEDAATADGGSDAGAGSNAGASSDAGASADGGNSDGGTSADAGASNGAHFFLPTHEPDNTSAPTVEVDGAGNVHSVYPAYAGGDAYYSLCASDGSCSGSDSAKVVHFQTEGTVANVMIALTSDGKPRILLSAYSQVYWGACDQNCGERASWIFAPILNHGGKRQITGEALALDGQGRPRFLMHTYRALWGIGQEKPEEIWAQCDAACEQPESWHYSVLAPEIWDGSHLRFDAQGHAHVATTVVPFEGNVPKDPLTAYLLCDGGDCSVADAFHGIGFVPPYESRTDAVNMYPAVSLALTKAGAPRVALIGKTPEGKKQLQYLQCDANCKQVSGWSGVWL
ncbi:MAG TPA: hypothetical protein VFZ61_04090, partial [Polyangiales bacterium]